MTALDAGKLELKLKAAPSPEVSLVIVHVNEHYESLSVCENDVRKLLEARVALNVYEHSAYYQSVLAEILGLTWPKTRENNPRYTPFQIDGIFYHIVDNETIPGNYEIDGLQGRRLIVIGGGIDYCHKLACASAAGQLIKTVPDKVSEIHIPIDCLYESSKGYDCGEYYLQVSGVADCSKLLGYAEIMAASNISNFVSIDGRILNMNASFEEPTLHLAIWSSSDIMISYLRNKERLRLKEEREK